MNLLFIILDLTHFLRISQVWIVSSEPYDLLQVVKFIFTFEDVFTSQKCCMKFTVGFFDDGDNHFTGDVAAHDERVGFVEFSCVNEFQEAFLGAMEICSEEDLCGGQASISLKLQFIGSSERAVLFEHVNVLGLAHLLQNFWPDGYADLTQMCFAK